MADQVGLIARRTEIRGERGRADTGSATTTVTASATIARRSAPKAAENYTGAGEKYTGPSILRKPAMSMTELEGPLLVCYDRSADAPHAIELAGTALPRPA